jgi:hypothetical protein
MASSTPNPFDWHVALQQADRILSAPPVKAHTERPTIILQTRVFRAAIPSGLCLAVNEVAGLRRAPKGHFVLAGILDRLWAELSKQAIPWLKYRAHWPLELSPPRPQVLAVKFSSRAPDVGANFGKMGIDMLQCRKHNGKKSDEHRMGLIVDDRPECVQQLHWHEFLPRKYPAFVLIEVRI